MSVVLVVLYSLDLSALPEGALSEVWPPFEAAMLWKGENNAINKVVSRLRPFEQAAELWSLMYSLQAFC